DVFDTDRAVAAVEVLHLTGAYVCSADREPRIAFVHQREVDEFEQCLFKRSGGVKASGIRAKRNMCSEERPRVGLKKIWNAAKDCLPVGDNIGQSGPRQSTERRPIRHPSPKFFQSFEAAPVRVAGDETCIDCTDRCADNPVWFNAVLMERVI